MSTLKTKNGQPVAGRKLAGAKLTSEQKDALKERLNRARVAELDITDTITLTGEYVEALFNDTPYVALCCVGGRRLSINTFLGAPDPMKVFQPETVAEATEMPHSGAELLALLGGLAGETFEVIDKVEDFGRFSQTFYLWKQVEKTESEPEGESEGEKTPESEGEKTPEA